MCNNSYYIGTLYSVIDVPLNLIIFVTVNKNKKQNPSILI